jgi:ABC-2 type transport system permease protein
MTTHASTYASTHPRRALVLLGLRLTRRGTVLMAAAMGAYVLVEVAAYRAAYPQGVDPVQFAMFEDNPVVRMMQGVPSALDVAGGYMVWDGGWIMQIVLAVWAVLTTTRLLRGDEDTERGDVALAGRVRPGVQTASLLTTVGAQAVVVGAVAAAALVVSAQDVQGSLLFGVGLAGVTATFAGVAAVTSQLVQPRRRAAGLAAGVLALTYVLRMFGSSTDSRLWARWATPLGWVDVLDPYGSPNLAVLLPMVVVPVALALAAVLLRSRRDQGASLLASDADRSPRLRLLGSPLAFAWRSNLGVLTAWALGLAVFGAVMGALVGTMVDWLAQDEDYQRMFEQMGLDAAVSTLGFVAVIATMLGLAIALQVAWRVGAARAEEEKGLAEATLALPVSRVGWLGGHVGLAAGEGLLLALVTGSAVWLGCVASGLTTVSWWQATSSVLNVMPVLVLGGGLAVLAFGVAPRLTVAVPVSVTVVGYILTLVGPALSWPQWVLDLSPFTHLALVPAVPWAATSGTVMVCVGVLAAAVGVLAFRRRDLVGG